MQKHAKKELKNQWTATSQLTDNGNNTYTKKVFYKPVQSKKNGKWVPISGSLTQSKNQQELTTKNTKLGFQFQKKMKHGKYLTVNNDHHCEFKHIVL